MKRAAIALALMATACEPEPDLTVEQLRDPQACATCHPTQFDQWQGSMHAYAADDPVFLAMNARGQRETNGELGDFCVSCHAPMAVRTGATTDGTNLDEVPQHLKGVTCYFCHSIDSVTGDHNAMVTLADDGVMRGGIADPVDNTAHRSAYAPLQDRNAHSSSSMCGACHDIVTPAGVHLERTFEEWNDSLYSNQVPGQQLTCGNCHMDGSTGVAADAPDVALRTIHDHSMPAVDVALTPWPGIEEQKAAIQRLLDGTLVAELCVKPDLAGVVIDVSLDNAFAGHSFPSGAAQDRRAWVELTAYDDADAVVLESGKVADGEAVAELTDPNLWLMRDRVFDMSGAEAHMFWEVRSYESDLLPAAVTADPANPAFFHNVVRSYPLPNTTPARVEMRVHMRAMGREVLEDLVQSGDLDPSVIDAMPQFTLSGTELSWSLDADGFGCVP